MDQDQDKDQKKNKEEFEANLSEKRQDELYRKSIIVWEKFVPQRREKVMKRYSGRFVAAFSTNKHNLYLSDLVLIKLGHPSYISVFKYKHYMGLMAAGPEDGIKLVNKPNASPFLNVGTFVKEYEEKMKVVIQPGVYEAEVDVVDGQYRMIVVDLTSKPSVLRTFRSPKGKPKEDESEENIS